jgi:hypothetical protein
VRPMIAVRLPMIDCKAEIRITGICLALSFDSICLDGQVLRHTCLYHFVVVTLSSPCLESS